MHRLTSFVFVVLGLSAGAAGAQTVGRVDPASIEAWKGFRAAQPFQTQLISVTPAGGKGPRTLVFAEPSPAVRWPVLTQQLAAHVTGCSVQEWSVMAGGSVKDVVCTLTQNPGEGWADTLARLQIDAYGTAAAAPVVALPVPPRQMLAHSLDLRFSAADLHAWLAAERQLWRAGPIGREASLPDLLDGGVRGVFTNAARTLVLWALDRGGSLDGAQADIRRFAVDSDLVLGAVAGKNAVLIVGRGRLEPLAHLPPLRGESVLLLAGTAENQLAQSYERNDVLAGKGFDGVDRAPILLSPQLVDTELGTLLNVADQLLKGWSMAGQVQYGNFRYPAPRSYPFGATPALYVEKGRSGFLFNWNTDGVAYRQDVRGLDVVVPQRTGALSVVYGDAANRPRGMEDTAYNHFATSGDTTLARVVQYTLLYQVFRQFGMHAAAPPVSARYAGFAANLRDATRAQLRLVLSDMGDEELNRGLFAYWTAYVARVPESSLAEGHRKELIARQVRKAVLMVSPLRRAQAASRGAVSDALADVAEVARRRTRPLPQDERTRQSALRTLAGYLTNAEVNAALGNQAEGLRESGLLQVAAQRSGGWASLVPPADAQRAWDRTAYVVESRGEGRGVTTVGGHNIDAPLVRFNASERQPRGQVAVSRDAAGQWVVTHSTADADRLREIARQVGTRSELTKPQIEAEVNQALRRSKAQAPVSLSELRNVAAARDDFKPLGDAESVYRVRGVTGAEQQLLAALAAARQDAIVLDHAGPGIVLSRTGSPQALQVASPLAAADALAQGLGPAGTLQQSVAVVLKGVPDTQAEAAVGGLQAALHDAARPLAACFVSAGGREVHLAERAQLLQARLAHSGVRVHAQSARVEKVRRGGFDGYSRLELPITLLAPAPWQLRLVFLSKDMAPAARDALLARAAAVLAEVREPVSVAELQLTLHRQLRAELERLGVAALLMRIDNEASALANDTVLG